jgi:hypothetical protein
VCVGRREGVGGYWFSHNSRLVVVLRLTAVCSSTTHATNSAPTCKQQGAGQPAGIGAYQQISAWPCSLPSLQTSRVSGDQQHVLHLI